MFNKLKQHLLTFLLNQCLKAIGEASATITFMSATNKADIRQNAKEREIYVLNNQHLTKYYYYSEPGNPFLAEHYFCLSGFLFSIVAYKARAKYSPVAMQLTFFPEKCPYQEVNEYLQKKLPVDSHIGRIQTAMEIDKYLARLTFSKIDVVLRKPIAQLTEYAVFGNVQIKLNEIPSLLFGDWVSYGSTRNYGRLTYESQSTHPGEEKVRDARNYRIIRSIGRMLIALVAPNEGELAWEERLILSPDTLTLTIWNEKGSTVFKRPTWKMDSR